MASGVGPSYTSPSGVSREVLFDKPRFGVCSALLLLVLGVLPLFLVDLLPPTNLVGPEFWVVMPYGDKESSIGSGSMGLSIFLVRVR